MVPSWLHTLFIAALLLGTACSLAVSIDVVRRPQHMAVMNVVWPVCALVGMLAVVWAISAMGASPRWRRIIARRHRAKRRLM